MEVIHQCCAGLDVHKKTIVACVRDARGHSIDRKLKTFGTMVKDLIALFDWLAQKECTHVVMEATGVYWKPVWKALDGGFELILANAAAVKNVPGRKSDAKDAEWLADLLAHGLVRASLVPSEDVRDLRELTRTRKRLVQEQVQHKQRIHKILEGCNIKLSSVISDITGATGRRILDALVRGVRDPIVMADMMHPSMKPDKWLDIAHSLQSSIRPHDAFLIGTHLEVLDMLQQQEERLSKRVEEVLSADFREAIQRLETIPGVSERVAVSILAEVGGGVSTFPTPGHLASWAGLCPRMDESAGKRRCTRIRKGAQWLKPELVQAAWAAVRKKDSYMRARFYRLKSRRGPQKAIIAIARKILIAAYFILRDRVEYDELGGDFYDKQDRQRAVQRHVSRLIALGCRVEISELPDAA